MPLGDNQMASAGNEMFGSVATIIQARDGARAPAIVNDLEYGLSGAVFTRDSPREGWTSRRRCRRAHVDDSPIHDEHGTAAGGEEDSG